MHKAIFLSAILIVLTFGGCRSETDAPIEQPQPRPRAAAAPRFVPANDSTITVRQFRLWRDCNPVLDSLTYFYKDSFAVADPVSKLRLQEDFIKAKDKICKLAGLSGGYTEYKWIMESIANPRNKELLDENL
ncbi:MAG: hypothetical protein LBI42_01980 [Chitinispirillales bacterium]|jgi:hypothetical protein|nr:hypothetical protein [Chitinispirillales bacterium]